MIGGAIIDGIFGPLGAVLLAILVGVAAWFKGRSDANLKRDLRDHRSYSDERKEIDNEDLGLGASDRERIERLQDIANGR